MLNPDFKEYIRLLNANGVRYLVIGVYAVALHGHPRYTKDLDVWIERDPDNAAKLLQALVQFGVGSLDLKAQDFLEPEQVIQLGYPPKIIDLITSPPGVDFDRSCETRVEVTIDDVPVNFIDLENLKRTKKAAGRLQDLADLENLQ